MKRELKRINPKESAAESIRECIKRVLVKRTYSGNEPTTCRKETDTLEERGLYTLEKRPDITHKKAQQSASRNAQRTPKRRSIRCRKTPLNFISNFP